jgi:hypothetical protein
MKRVKTPDILPGLPLFKVCKDICQTKKSQFWRDWCLSICHLLVDMLIDDIPIFVDYSYVLTSSVNRVSTHVNNLLSNFHTGTLLSNGPQPVKASVTKHCNDVALGINGQVTMCMYVYIFIYIYLYSTVYDYIIYIYIYTDSHFQNLHFGV